MSPVSLTLQIAAVRAEAEAAASYAASPAVRDVPILARAANARRDALQTAVATLEAEAARKTGLDPDMVADWRRMILGETA